MIGIIHVKIRSRQTPGEEDVEEGRGGEENDKGQGGGKNRRING